MLGLVSGLLLTLVLLPVVDVLPELLGVELGISVLVDTLVPKVDLVAGLGEDGLELVGGDLSASADELKPDLVVDLASGLGTLFLLALDEAVGVEAMILVEVHVEQSQLVLEGVHRVTLVDDLLEKLVSIREFELALDQNSGSMIEIWCLQHQVEASVG